MKPLISLLQVCSLGHAHSLPGMIVVLAELSFPDLLVMMSASFGIILLFPFLSCSMVCEIFSSVVSDSLWPHEPQHARPPCPSPTPRVRHPNPRPLSWWCHPTISSSVTPSPPAFRLPQHKSLFQWGRPTLYRQGTNNLLGRQIIVKNYRTDGASLVAKWIKNSAAMQETQIWSLGQEDPLEKEMATHSSILAWRIPWTQDPGRLQSMGL